MKVYKHNSDDATGSIRTHPWTVAATNPDHRYYDFKAHPEIIPIVLEDFQPWSTCDAIQEFYKLLAWVNSSDSVLESNDCAFGGIYENTNTNFEKPLQCAGRVMLFYRHIKLNSSQEYIDWLEGALHHYLGYVQPSLEYGVVGTSQFPVRYLALPSDGDKDNGRELVIHFWCWGDNQDEVMFNLHLLVEGLFEAIRDVSGEIQSSTNS